jgi:hypothetical protein
VYNQEIDPRFSRQILQAKERDGKVLESSLAVEAIQTWSTKLAPCGMTPPPEEVVAKPGASFLQCSPGYRVWDDMWDREMTLRNLDEALRGDLMNPMPRPVTFGEDYENHHTGRYLKDECPIA